MKNETYNIEILESNENFKNWTDNLQEENKESLYKKDMLILPNLSYGSINQTLYHEDLMDFIEYLEERDSNITYGLCSDEEEILSLNDAEIWLGGFLVTAAQNPIFINILSAYLYDKFLKLGKNPKVKCSLKVVEDKDKKSKEFNYEGDAQTFQNIAQDLIKSFEDA